MKNITCIIIGLAVAIFSILLGIFIGGIAGLYGSSDPATSVVHYDFTNQEIRKPFAEGDFAWGVNAVYDDTEGIELFKYAEDTPRNNAGCARINNVTFPAFQGNDRDILLRHLASSAKWRVSEYRGDLVVFRRFPANGNWTALEHGRYEDEDLEYRFGTIYDKQRSPLTMSIAICPNGPVSYAIPNLNQSNFAPVGSGQIPFTGFLILEAATGAIMIMESNHPQGGLVTQEALNQISTELTAVTFSTAVQENGFDTSLMPSFSAQRRNAEIAVRKYERTYDHYFVDAYVNPGEKGRCFTRIFDLDNNRYLAEDLIKERTLEMTGWSDDPEEKFFYSHWMRIQDGEDGIDYPARVEIWFDPDDPEKGERLLVERAYTLTSWSH